MTLLYLIYASHSQTLIHIALLIVNSYSSVGTQFKAAFSGIISLPALTMYPHGASCCSTIVCIMLIVK